jgi:serine/threonine protein kinase
LPHLSDDAAFIKMFVEEAKLSARLNHPNIVHIFELGAVEGEYFISMEYIRGRDLSETMRAIWKTLGPPRPEMVAYIGREACRGLAYAHNLTDDAGRPLGMIHRDISPSNVMLSYEGAVKLLDFGIAKALGDTAEATKSGTMKGKYAYMAPEQTDGDNIDHRSDIFACGIVLHEVLTGRRLFKGQNDVQTIERVRRCEVPPPSLQNPAVPPALDAAVLRALARNPNDRWQSAAEMADALDDVVHDARFQPTHLAHLLYDLFPEGGGPRPASAQSTFPHGVTVTQGTGSGQHGTGSGQRGTGSGQSMRSRTVPPVVRTTSGPAPLPYSEGVASGPILKPKSRFPTFAILVLLLAGGGVGAWRFLGRRGPDFRVTGVGEGNRRVFYIHVKSTPEGADIFLDDGRKKRLMGSTPVTLPIDLTGLPSVTLHLKKEGFDEYEQRVTDDTPLSISLTPVGGAPAATGPGGAGAAATESAPAPKAESGPRPHHHRAAKADAPKDKDKDEESPKGEITE